ncbi:MAG: NUDIX domain-containing protein [Candidatus Magasanikbacteria bacterium]|jgi:8-oxo-dGTP diphosphatase|nr:NUDIX domain-containing protein [Candidatus Magasanikbacteria bacterium]MBT4071204.1 NUDIX domain-containing protein [Candidatus Magasanikbacteria bacterium]
MKKERFTAKISVHILFMKENSILLSLRKNITLDGLYGLVAGHLNGGETVTHAIMREAKEEVGVIVDPKDIKIANVCHNFNPKNNTEFVQFYTICKKWDGEITNAEPEKCGGLQFFPVDNLPDNIVPYIKDAIEKTLAGVTFYEYGWGEKEYSLDF